MHTPLVGNGKFETIEKEGYIFTKQVSKEFNGDVKLVSWLPIGGKVTSKDILEQVKTLNKENNRVLAPSYLPPDLVEELKNQCYLIEDDLTKAVVYYPTEKGRFEGIERDNSPEFVDKIKRFIDKESKELERLGSIFDEFKVTRRAVSGRSNNPFCDRLSFYKDNNEGMAVVFIKEEQAFVYMNTIENLHHYLHSLGINKIFYGIKHIFLRDDTPTLIPIKPEGCVLESFYLVALKLKSVFDCSEKLEPRLKPFDYKLAQSRKFRRVRGYSLQYEPLTVYLTKTWDTGCRSLFKIYETEHNIFIIEMTHKKVVGVNSNSETSNIDIDNTFLSSCGIKTYLDREVGGDFILELIENQNKNKTKVVFEYDKSFCNTEGKKGKNLRKILNRFNKDENLDIEIHKRSEISQELINRIVGECLEIKTMWARAKGKEQNDYTKRYSFLCISKYLKREYIDSSDITYIVMNHNGVPVGMSMTLKISKNFVELLEGCSLNIVSEDFDIGQIQKYFMYIETNLWIERLGDETLLCLGSADHYGLIQFKYNLSPKGMYMQKNF